MIYSIDSQTEAESISREAQLFLNRFENMRIPTVAAIHGSAMGGGFEVALACSHRVASSHRVTQIGLPEVKLGLIPGAGGTVRLARMIGLQTAMQMVLAGTTLGSRAAKALQLIDEVIEFDDEPKFFDAVRNYAVKLPKQTKVSKYARRKRTVSELLFEVSLLDLLTNLEKSTRKIVHVIQNYKLFEQYDKRPLSSTVHYSRHNDQRIRNHFRSCVRTRSKKFWKTRMHTRSKKSNCTLFNDRRNKKD